MISLNLLAKGVKVLAQLIESALDKSDMVEASALIESVRLEPLSVDVKAAIGRFLMKSGEPKRAARYFLEAAAETTDWSGQKSIAVAEQLLSHNQKVHALAVIGSALARMPNDERLLNCLPRLYAMAGASRLSLALHQFLSRSEESLSAEESRWHAVALIKEKRFAAGYSVMQSFVSSTGYAGRFYSPPQLTAEDLTELLAFDPEWDWLNFHLGNARYLKRDYDLARRCFEITLRSSSETLLDITAPKYAEMVRRSLPQHEALRTIRRLIERFPHNKDLLLYVGVVQYVAADIDAAARSFGALSTSQLNVNPAARGARSFRRPPTLPERGVDVPDSVELALVRGDDSLVYLFSADARYFKLFHDTALLALYSTVGDSPVHFHIVNPDQETMTLLQALRTPQGSRIGYSTSSVKALYPRPYYATARFMFASHIMDQYDRPVFITDIDALLTKDPRQGLAELGAFDVALKCASGEVLEFPWTGTAATFSIFRPTNGAKAFLERLSRYFWYIFENDEAENLWWIDQNALCYAAERTFPHSTRIVQIAGTKVDHCIRTNAAMASKEEFVAQARRQLPQASFPR